MIAMHVEEKGGYSYLSWTWAWAMVKDHYPEANYTIDDDVIYPDGTMEVRTTVTTEGMSHQLWLPVLDYKNKPIRNPNAFDINSARMRVLVKCLAFFGLGHYIYAGESLPQPRVEAVGEQAVQRIDVVEALIKETDTDREQFFSWLGKDPAAQWDQHTVDKAIHALQQKKTKMEAQS